MGLRVNVSQPAVGGKPFPAGMTNYASANESHPHRRECGGEYPMTLNRIMTISLASAAMVLFGVLFIQSPAQAAATLTGIDVTPHNPSINKGLTQTFAAIGVFSDGSTRRLLGSPVVQVAPGTSHTCARLANGTVQCWGDNSKGQLGNGTYRFSETPVMVSGIDDAVALTAGARHTCALLAGGSLKCWGDNNYGQVGGGSAGRFTPVTVAGVADAISVAAGEQHTCAALGSGEVRCWGDNYFGELGNGGPGGVYNSPVAVVGIATATAVTGGGDHSCASLADGSVKCWGWNISGQFGDGSTTTARTPVAVVGIDSAIAVTAGGYHTCALLDGGAVQCWGSAYDSQLGNGMSSGGSTVPVSVIGIATATAVAAGQYHTCAALAGGGAKCWGRMIAVNSVTAATSKPACR